MAEFENYEDMKREAVAEQADAGVKMASDMRDLSAHLERSAGKGQAERDSDMWRMAEVIVLTFAQRFPEAWSQFQSQLKALSGTTDRFGASLAAGKEEKAMEMRKDFLFPTAVYAEPDPMDLTGQRQIERRESVLSPLKGLFARYGFRDFPMAETPEEAKMMREFHSRFGRWFSPAEDL